MTEINKERENLNRSPFQEEIVLDNYFPCGRRADVLTQIEQAVQNGVALMVLTGEEGSGKTMLCRVLEYEALCQTVFFPCPVDSFEEIVRNILISLGIKKETEIDIGDVDQSLQLLLDFQLNQSADLLVIFDEAENIFLATLERIRKMLDQIDGTGAGIHILLSGRETLLENCDQVSLGNFQNADARHFELSPLSEDETAYYLQFCAARLPGIDAAKVFTDEVISNIYILAQGNFRRTNILGEESVKLYNDDTSFKALLEGDEEGVDMEHETPGGIKYPQPAGKLTTYLSWIGGAVFCLSLLLFLFRSGGDKIEVDQNTVQTPKADQIEKVTTSQETSDSLSQKEELVDLEPVDELQPPGEEDATISRPENKGSGQEAVAVQQSVENSPPPVAGQGQGKPEQVAPETSKTLDTVATGDSRDNAPVAETEETEETEEVVAAKKENPPKEAVTREKNDIVLLRPGKLVKKKTKGSPAQLQQEIKPQSPDKVLPKVAVATPHSAADTLYSARLSAGSGWESTKKKEMYTVQIMALTSKTAVTNLKKILARANYRQEAENFYIFEKRTAPKSVFVFYGEYPSIDRANLAQNRFPQFLRDHKPYVLSIKRAVAKVGK